MEKDKLLNWLKSEQSKDFSELEKEKKLFAQQMLKMKKEELFIKEKVTLWSRIKTLLWGN